MVEKAAPHSREETNATRLKSQSATVVISIWSSMTGFFFFFQTVPHFYAFKRDINIFALYIIIENSFILFCFYILTKAFLPSPLPSLLPHPFLYCFSSDTGSHPTEISR